MVDIQAVRAKVAGYARVVAQEAAGLLRRRKLSYAALALTLTAGSLYFSGVRPALITSGGHTPAPATDDRSTGHSHPQPLQAVTGQGAGQSASNSDAQGGTTQQSHTSVTVNGTDIPVPADGEVHTTMTNDGGTTSVSVSHNSSGDNSYSSLDVQVFSQSTASEGGN